MKPATSTPAAAANTKPDHPATSVAPTQPPTTSGTNLFGGGTTTASAPAPGLFSFGTVGDSNKKVESKGGFSFGPTSVVNTSTENKDQNSTTTTTKEPAPATASGFSFGITSSTATTTPTDKPGFHLFAGKTDNGSITTSTAPSTTSESDGSKKGSAPETPTTTFKFGSTAGSSNPSTTTTTTTEAGSSKATAEIGTAPAPTPTGPPPPLEYQTKTVQEIINSFSEHLENDAIEFVKQAQRVAEWDAVLRDSQAGMEGLTEKISQLLFQQQEVDRTLNAISAYQRETESTLDVVEVRIFLFALFLCFFFGPFSLFIYF